MASRNGHRMAQENCDALASGTEPQWIPHSKENVTPMDHSNMKQVIRCKSKVGVY